MIEKIIKEKVIEKIPKPKKEKYSLTIGWLYPDLMSIYGDRGNIITLQKRAEARGIKVKIKNISVESSITDLIEPDLLFMGGSQDSQQTVVSDNLKEGKNKILWKMIEDGVPGLYICGAYQLLGKYYKEADGTIIEGLGIFDIYTENPGKDNKRLIGNVAAELNPHVFLRDNSLTSLVGFENHGGRTYLGDKMVPLAKVIKGYGNNGEDKTEGAIYKNSIGSYFHGPILPKNPEIADFLIDKALEKKYGHKIELRQLDDALSKIAHGDIMNYITRQ